MAITGRFRVEPRLIQILGAQYNSTEEAIKELVANAWDADASRVEITLPGPLTTDPIVVCDDGYGMTPREIQSGYLRVAYDRRHKGGERTVKGRVVRGYRGIGKFAGLTAAQTMTVTTISRGVQSRLELDRQRLEEQTDDLENAKIDIDIQEGVPGAGTTVVLSGLRQTFAHPSDAKLGRLLMREFGRQDDFTIVVNGDLVTLRVLAGKMSTIELSLPDGAVISSTVWLLERRGTVPDPGIIVRVDGRAIGPPTFFGLDRDDEIPKSLLHRVYGEVHADHLKDDDLAPEIEAAFSASFATQSDTGN